MAKQTINIGSSANDGTGDPLRTAFQKINDNFAELYGDDSSADTFSSPQITTPTITGTTTIDHLIFNDNYISTATNANLELNPGGTGTIELQAATNITGALDVTGAVTLDTSLTLTAGAAVNEFSIDGTLAGNSDSAVPTEKAVKTYVDAQVTASNLAFAGDTGGTLNIDLDSETLTIAGGTGIDTSGSGNTLTIDIDSSVVTLTGGQTLTNKTLTTPTISSPNITGHATIEGVTPTGATGTGNLVFSASPTLTGTLTAANISASGTLAAGNTTISGSLSSQDLTVTGSQSVSGNIIAQGTVYSDRIQSPASNADLSLSAQGTGAVDIQSPMTTVAQTVNGNITMPDGFIAELGNIQIYSNTLTSTTNGNINIVANGTGQISLQSAVTSAYQVNAVSFRASDTVDTNRLRSYSSNADIVLEPQGTGTVDFKLPTQATVGSAGGASALPATPSGYIEFKINGTAYVMPYYAKS
jgi:cytoskeletal protein CcmA (bactofilin family)